MLLRYQRRLVNEVVWSFCWQCRNPQRSYAPQWRWILTTWSQHTASQEDSNYGKRTKEYYKPFLNYAQATYEGPYSYYVSLLRALELYTSAWREEQFSYAEELLRKYYGKGTCDE